MVRITFINGSYYCESGITKFKLKRDSYDRNGTRRRLNAHEIVTFINIYEDVYGKWVKVKTGNKQLYDVRAEDLIYQKEHLRK